LQVLTAGGIRVIAVDIAEKKVAAASRLGAEVSIMADDNAIPEVQKLALPDGVQCVFDCVGSRQTLNDACRMAMNGGRVVVIGEQDESCPMTSTLIAQRELEIVGSRNGTRQDMVEAIRLVDTGKVQPPIAAVFPLDEVNDALRTMKNGVVGRVVVRVSGN
jgi:D-arabinose 1-dehydrogenase-like Zn-dependent alcohol dehydrogenase